jgi:raffinose/stachyose/melibiose transport system substrate-binding protein
MTSRLLRTAIATIAVAGVTALAACAPSAGDSGSKSSKDQKVSTDISDAPKQTLTVWDQEVRGGQNKQIEQLNKAFMEKYPNIKIERKSQSFDDLQTTLRLALTGNDAPDVVQANNARNTLGQFVSSDQVRCLDPWAKAYGWEDRYSESILKFSKYSEDAKKFGEGCVYGLPQMGEVVGIFYSKKKLKELGLSEPKTWEEFSDQLKTIKDKDETPLVLGNVEKWPGLHVYGPVQGAHVDADTINTLAFGNPGASWNTKENVAAAKQLQDWADSGYFNDGFNGADYDKVWQNFSQGDGVYLIGGSWLAADLSDAMGDDVAFMAPPQAKGHDKVATTGGTGLPFAMTSAAEDQNVAAAYIDFLTSDDAMKVLADTGNVPVNKTADFADGQDGVVADVMKTFTEVSTKGDLLPYLDYATPTFDQVAGDAVQGLLDKKLTPEKFNNKLEKAYKEFTKK